eukprot:scaffold36038_cov26-Tisochrysis_lutea.AAC.1
MSTRRIELRPAAWQAAIIPLDYVDNMRRIGKIFVIITKFMTQTACSTGDWCIGYWCIATPSLFSFEEGSGRPSCHRFSSMHELHTLLMCWC